MGNRGREETRAHALVRTRDASHLVRILSVSLLVAGCTLPFELTPTTRAPTTALPSKEGTRSGPERPAAASTTEVAGPQLLLRGARVMTATGADLDRADILIAGETISQIGASIQARDDAEVLELEGRWVTPGLIDPHSHLGVAASPHVGPHADANESSDPFTPEVRASESFWPQDPALRTASAGGVTLIHVLPGSANLVGGQGVTLHVRPGRSADDLRLKNAPATMKMACGENPKRVYGSRRAAPVTRMGEVALLRQALENARVYAPDDEGPRDFGKLALRTVVRGETLVQNHCYRADEMLLRLSLFQEFGFAPRAFHHATEAYKIRDELARAGVGAVVWADWWGLKMEMLDAVPANAALLDAAGVRVALHSDSPDDIQRLNQQAARALAAGRRAGLDVTRDRALRWITANPAWILGIEDRYGTLEPGKMADLVVWSDDPFSVYARAELVFIGGRRVYDRSNPARFPESDFELGRAAPAAESSEEPR